MSQFAKPLISKVRRDVDAYLKQQVDPFLLSDSQYCKKIACSFMATFGHSVFFRRRLPLYGSFRTVRRKVRSPQATALLDAVISQERNPRMRAGFLSMGEDLCEFAHVSLEDLESHKVSTEEMVGILGNTFKAGLAATTIAVILEDCSWLCAERLGKAVRILSGKRVARLPRRAKVDAECRKMLEAALDAEWSQGYKYPGFIASEASGAAKEFIKKIFVSHEVFVAGSS